MPSTSRTHAGICAQACICHSFITGLTLVTFPFTSGQPRCCAPAPPILSVHLNTDRSVPWRKKKQADVQTGSTMSPPEKWNSFSCRVNLFKESFYCDLKANIKLPAGKRDTCMRYALFHRGQMSVLSHVPSLIVSKIKWTRSLYIRRISEPTEMVK